MQRRARRGKIERLSPIPGAALFAGVKLKIAPGQINANAIPPYMIERFVRRDFSPTLADTHDKLNLIVEVFGLRRVGDDRPGIDNRIGRLGKKEWWFAIRITPQLSDGCCLNRSDLNGISIITT